MPSITKLAVFIAALASNLAQAAPGQTSPNQSAPGARTIPLFNGSNVVQAGVEPSAGNHAAVDLVSAVMALEPEIVMPPTVSLIETTAISPDLEPRKLVSVMENAVSSSREEIVILMALR
ncbi:hypothetical protein MaudCBS49596_000078 [Microsporum audouinii]